MSPFEWILLILTALFAGGYVLMKIAARRLRRSGVNCLEPLPFFGNLLWILLGREQMAGWMKRLCDAYPEDRYVAIFEFFKPTIIIKDPELINKLTIKDFDKFHDIPFNVDTDIEPIFGNVLFNLKGSKWRQMRSTVSPAFTSSKMKFMYTFMTNGALRFIAHYEDQCAATGSLGVDIKDLTTRFINDIIASTTFGLEIDSLKDRDNQFYENSKEILAIRLGVVFKFLAVRLFPSFMKAFKIPIFPQEPITHLKNLTLSTMEDREKSGIRRRDMLDQLIEAKKGSLQREDANEEKFEFASTEETLISENSKKKWTDDELVSQAITFILGGFSTTGTALNFLFYELALNEDIQRKLQREIDEVIRENGDDIQYYTIMKMNYLDMVVSEVLRKWPPIPNTNRLCNEDYDLGPVRPGSDQTFKVHKGDSIYVPVWTVHRDPNLWSNPEKFDPERFSLENRSAIKPYTYRPFGTGPRNCVGSRFSLLIMKALVFYILSKFDFEVSVKTPVPMVISTKTLFIDSRDGFWMNMKRRR